MYWQPLRFGIKSAILGGVVYYTVDQGVWKDSTSTAVLYEHIQKKVSPYAQEVKSKIPYELPELPDSDRISYLGKYYWNAGVKTAFQFLVDLPTHAETTAIKGYNAIANALNPEDVAQKAKKIDNK